ncbi:MAG: diheme cytochrome c-553 [Bacteroidetes bacterium]|nr:diheme cytochrome c-553 [Bacteroidota bacterium]
MKKHFLFFASCSVILVFIFLQLDCSSKKMSNDELIARGKYLVQFGGCNDCHTPKMMTAMGPVPDTTKLLSGHPADQPIPQIEEGMTAPGKWVLSDDGSTMWFGPWGASFTANLTPDSSTGLGAWTLDNFINTMRTGKHLGTGRDLLPPMPWQGIASLNDEDLNAMFAYLKSIPPINNRVPNPTPPNMPPANKN